MKLSLDKCRVSTASRPAAIGEPDYSFYEYQWNGPKRAHVPLWQPRQTTFVVLFERESRHLFSTAHIVLFYRKGSSKDARSQDAWDVQQLGPVIHSLRGQVRNALPNLSTLPKLTIAFEVAASQMASKFTFDPLVLRSPASVQELHNDSISVLIEHEVPLTSDTLSLSLSFTHSTILWTPITPAAPARHSNPTFWIQYITTRVVRVVPTVPVSASPRIANSILPTELLVRIFEDAEFEDSWRDDLLSFAQVCAAWSCAMHVLHSRLSFSDDEDKWDQPRGLLDVYALANVLGEKPLLGHTFRHFTTHNFKLGASEDAQDVCRLAQHADSARFTAALITILRTAKNLRWVHLEQLDPCQADAVFAALRGLRDVHTLSIGQVEERLVGEPLKHRRMDGTTRMLSVAQLARCMARWPALKVLKLHHLHPLVLGIWRFALRPPGCALTQLVICRSHMADKDLLHLFASSAKTLERVVLDRIEGVTNVGLSAFLLAISQNVVYLTVQEVALPPFRRWGHLVIGRAERALDIAVDKMPRLRELRISGDVASEFMLDRRSKMFVAHNASQGVRVPVVRLWLDDVPRLCGFTADGKWAGWCTPGGAP